MHLFRCSARDLAMECMLARLVGGECLVHIGAHAGQVGRRHGPMPASHCTGMHSCTQQQASTAHADCLCVLYPKQAGCATQRKSSVPSSLMCCCGSPRCTAGCNQARQLLPEQAGLACGLKHLEAAAIAVPGAEPQHDDSDTPAPVSDPAEPTATFFLVSLSFVERGGAGPSACGLAPASADTSGERDVSTGTPDADVDIMIDPSPEEVLARVSMAFEVRSHYTFWFRQHGRVLYALMGGTVPGIRNVCMHVGHACSSSEQRDAAHV